MSLILYPPNPLDCIDSESIVIFLAGSIEMGRAEDWQKRLIEELKDHNVVILNPRRADWDSSWEQKASNPYFAGQVNWELDGIERADIMALYLQPGTISPISLLEYGLVAARVPSAIALHCPEGFHRKGNVDIVANRAGIVNHETWDQWVDSIKRRIAMRQCHQRDIN